MSQNLCHGGACVPYIGILLEGIAISNQSSEFDLFFHFSMIIACSAEAGHGPSRVAAADGAVVVRK